MAGVGMYALALYVTRSRSAALLAGFLRVLALPTGCIWARSSSSASAGYPDVALFGSFLEGRSPARWTDARVVHCGADSLGILLRFPGCAHHRDLCGLRLLPPRQPESAPARARHCRGSRSATLLILPFALPDLRVRTDLGLDRSLGEAAQSGATLAEFFLPRQDNPLYPQVCDRWFPMRADYSPGLIVGLLALTGWIVWPKRQGSGVGPVYLIVLGDRSLGSGAGPRLMLTGDRETHITLPFAWLFQHIPGMTIIRSPGRFSASLYLVIALAAAVGAGWLLRRLPAGSTCCSIGIVYRSLSRGVPGGPRRRCRAEHSFADLPARGVRVACPAVQGRNGGIPVNVGDGRSASQGVGEDAFQAWPDFNTMRYQFFATTHWRPTVDGYSGFRPPHHRELGLTLASFRTWKHRPPAGIRRGMDSRS